MKKRLDIVIVERGFAETRSKARGLIMAGSVVVDGKKITKAGTLVDEKVEIEMNRDAQPFVSRGGLKLQQALKEFKIDVDGLVCLDAGASTGGFTDCLLKNGARRVYAIDVGYGQLDWKLRKDNRVINLERTNIRHLDLNCLKDEIDLVTADLAFIGLEKVMPKIDEIIKKGGLVILLVKPQFQVKKELVGKGGVIKDENIHKLAVDRVKEAASKLGWNFKGVIPSPIKGPKGNREFLGYWIA